MTRLGQTLPNADVMVQSPHFVSCLSTLPDTRQAVSELVANARSSIKESGDLACLFFSQHHTANSQYIAEECSKLLKSTGRLLGCGGESIVGSAHEVEGSPAISLWIASLPGAQVTTAKLDFERTHEGNAFVGWPDEMSGEWPQDSFLIVLGEPFSFPADALLEQLNQDRPGVAVVGGMASGGQTPGKNQLILGDEVFAEGAVVARISGNVRLRTVVSQGCRPIGNPLVVTKAERNVIYQLGGKPALDQLKAIFATLPTTDQRLVNQGLHIGRVVSEYRERFEQGDFLIRSVLGGDTQSGAIAVGDYIRAGQTVQFQVRDASSADAELRQLLAEIRDNYPASSRGALLFTCNGRGTRLFPNPDHDASAISETLGEIPVAGFFAQGEIGPIGGNNFLHGFTASIAIIEPKA